MPTLHTLLVFAGAALVLAVLPGPSLLYVAAGATASRGRVSYISGRGECYRG